MCAGKGRGRVSQIARISLCAIAFGAFSAKADDGFSGGSFEDGSFDSGNAGTPDNTVDTPGGDGFGGSFGESGTPGTPPTGDQFGFGSFEEAPGSDTPPGGDGFGGGSFGDDTVSTDVVTPEQQDPPPGGDDFSNGFDTPPEDQVITGVPETHSEPDVKSDPPPDGHTNTINPQILAFESRDFGVPPTNRLRSAPLHAPTPTAVPGAATVNTADVAAALSNGQQLVMIDVLGGDYSLPGAYVAPALASPGDFNDRTQQQAAQWLAQITGGQRDLPIVLYCSDPQCWLSYNATLRTVAAGFTNAYWYRGGLQAWQMAGLQVVPAGF